MEENEVPEDVDGCFEGEEDEYEDECDDGDPPDDYEFEIDFADPGGWSALRAATPTNPRNLPCPTCHEPDKLTPADVALGYQCDDCADAAEGIGY